LDTVIDSDRILVMNAGVIAEYDRPEVLLNDPTTIFHELCRNTGQAQFEGLCARANANAATRPTLYRGEEAYC
jgi:ABC-type proline/glycine betaine transport system ATPase subunit